jgi:hypothetical protein
MGTVIRTLIGIKGDQRSRDQLDWCSIGDSRHRSDLSGGKRSATQASAKRGIEELGNVKRMPSTLSSLETRTVEGRRLGTAVDPRPGERATWLLFPSSRFGSWPTSAECSTLPSLTEPQPGSMWTERTRNSCIPPDV